MAQLQPFINLQPFSGLESDNFNQFENPLRSCIGLAGVEEANRHLYLHLHLKGTALSFFDQLPEATRQNFDEALTSLRNRYVNPDRLESHKLKFTTRKYNASKETVHDFLTELQRMANLAFPDIVARAAADGNPAVAAENCANERNRRVKEAFINGLPNKLKKYLLTLPETNTVEDLCERAARRVMIDQQYPEDDGGSAFNELSSSQVDTLLASLAEIQKTQTAMRNENAKLAAEVKYLQNAHQNPTGQQSWSGHHQQQPGNNQPQWWNWNSTPPDWYTQHWLQQPQQQQQQGENNWTTYNQRFCNYCKMKGHTIQYCRKRPPPKRDQQVPFDRQPKN